MPTIALEGMQFRAYHGVYAEEQERGNDFEVDVRLHTAQPLPDTDDLADTLDYGQAYRVVAEVMAGRKQLLETLVSLIGRRLVALFPQVEAIDVRVTKRNPPVAGPCERSWVEARFTP